jgi:hypothetical protein
MATPSDQVLTTTFLRDVIESGTVPGIVPPPKTATPLAATATAGKEEAKKPTRPKIEPLGELGKIKPRATGPKPEATTVKPDTSSAPTEEVKKPARVKIEPLPADFGKAGVRAARPKAAALPKRAAPVLPEPLVKKVSSVSGVIAKKQADYSGDLGDSFEHLKELGTEDAEKVLVGLLDTQDKREMLLAYKDGALIAATIGATKKAGAEKAQAPLPKDGKDDIIDVAGTVITHTHPEGSPLSKGDVQIAIGRNVLEMRATGRNGTFALRRGADGWGAEVEDVTEFYASKGPAVWKSLADAVVAEKFGQPAPKADQLFPIGGDTASKQGANFAQDNCMQEHYALEELAKAHGLTYRSPDAKELAMWRLELYERRDGTGADKRAAFQGDFVQQFSASAQEKMAALDKELGNKQKSADW